MKDRSMGKSGNKDFLALKLCSTSVMSSA